MVNNTGKQKVYLVDKPGSPQSIVRFVGQGLPFDAQEKFISLNWRTLTLRNFNSRINQNSRKIKAIPMELVATLRPIGKWALLFSLLKCEQTLPRPNKEIQSELGKYSKGITEEEMEFLRLQWVSRMR